METDKRLPKNYALYFNPSGEGDMSVTPPIEFDPLKGFGAKVFCELECPTPGVFRINRSDEPLVFNMMLFYFNRFGSEAAINFRTLTGDKSSYVVHLEGTNDSSYVDFKLYKIDSVAAIKL